MSCWIMAQGPVEIADHILQTYNLDAKTGRVYDRLMQRLRLYGSAPFNERMLASLGQCTMHWFVKRAWPVLQETFEVRDGRIYHPDVRGIRSPPAAETAPVGLSARSVAAQKAANAKWGKASLVDSGGDAPDDAERMPSASAAHAPEHAEGMRSASGNDAISMTCASETHEKTDAETMAPHAGGMPGASADASGASGVARAPSPLLSSFSPSESGKNLSESEGGGARAGAGAHAADDAPGHAQDMRSASAPHAQDDAQGMRSASAAHAPRTRAARRQRRAAAAAPPASAPLPADWGPSPAGQREARKRGYEPVEIAEDFCLHYRATGAERADWDAEFIVWCRRQTRFDGKAGAQRHLAMPIAGDAPAPVASEADQALRKRLGSIATMRGRWSGAPLAPPFQQLRQAGDVGLAWLQRMEGWERGGFRGERPPEFAAFLAGTGPPAERREATG